MQMITINASITSESGIPLFPTPAGQTPQILTPDIISIILSFGSRVPVTGIEAVGLIAAITALSDLYVGNTVCTVNPNPPAIIPTVTS